jgi:hypothetical protein
VGANHAPNTNPKIAKSQANFRILIESKYTVVNAQRRVLETIGLRRQPRDVTPSVAEYVAGIAAGEKADAA